MLLQSLSCGSCGAPLDVPDSTDFVTCAYCKTRLIVKRTSSAAYTEVLDRIDERTERMSDDLTVIRLYTELEWLERDWQSRQEGYDSRRKTLARSVADAEQAKTGAVWPLIWLAIGVGLFFLPPSPHYAIYIPWIPLLIITFAALPLLTSLDRARRHSKLLDIYNLSQEDCLTAEQEYMDRRRELKRKIESLSQPVR